MIMLSEVAAEQLPSPIMLRIDVVDGDAAFDHVVAAGDNVVSAPADQFYCDRSGGVVEATGNMVWIATHIEDVSPKERQRRAAARGGR